VEEDGEVSSQELPKSQMTEVLEGLAAVEKAVAIPGLGSVKAAFPVPPADPSSSMCPFFANSIVGGGPVKWLTLEMYEIVTKVQAFLAVSRKESDATLVKVQVRAVDWRDALLQQITRAIRLHGQFGVTSVQIVHWDLVAVKLGTAEFVGPIYDLEVTETIEFSRGD
jgi:hypothetical protein